MRFLVLVLGDLNRSPRMLYHAESLEGDVHLVGYNRVVTNVQVHSIPQVRFKPWILSTILRILLECFWLMYLLLKIKPDYIIVQNPPSYSALMAVKTLRLQKKLVVDWHNLGYTILSLTKPKTICFFAQKLEMYLCFEAKMHLFVSKMLMDNVQVKGQKMVLYDLPQQAFQKRKVELKIFRPSFELTNDFLVCTSTSWTPDEDFELLYHCLLSLDKELKTRNQRIQFVITGKGPLRLKYEAKLNFSNVLVQTGWLRADLYPKLLGCADLGVCLHSSSSGFDLPMKVVDMFGCGLPVLGYEYPAIHELINNNLGRLFQNSEELKDLILYFFDNKKELEILSLNIQQKFKHERWQQYYHEFQETLIKL